MRIADSLLLPVAQFTYIASTRIPDTNMTIGAFVKENNVYTQVTGNPLMIRSVRQLNEIAPSSEDRAMAYVKDMEVLRFHVPQELQFIEPQRGPGPDVGILRPHGAGRAGDHGAERLPVSGRYLMTLHVSPDTCAHRLELTPNMNAHTKEWLYECRKCGRKEWR